ncbi:MAG: FAD-dependent oxidoreductase, partial [Paracoccaceae bacterium]
FGALVAALAQSLPGDRVMRSTPISGLTLHDDKIAVEIERETISANRVVLAVPPRIAANMSFEPALPPSAITAMQNVATWMAGQAKAIAVYDNPFWREAGLSGDAMSRVGPMVEIHDASPKSGDKFALFGFIGTPPSNRRDEERLRQHISAQLVRLLGPKAGSPLDLFVKDWAFDPRTSTQADLAPLTVHPHYGLPPAMTDLWEGRVIFGGTEVAPEFGGYLEGALEAAEIAIRRLSINSETTL